MRVKLQDLLRQGEIVLKERKIEQYRNDAYCLLHKHFNVSRAQVLLSQEQDYPEALVLAYWADIRARGERRPLQHLLGSWEFMGLSFIVNPNVLIPRPETEWLVEYVLAHYQGKPVRVLDLCTGSGCIGLSIKKLLPESQVTLVDISDLALEVAREIACRLRDMGWPPERIQEATGLSGEELKNLFFQAEDGIRDFCLSRGLGDVYKRQCCICSTWFRAS